LPKGAVKGVDISPAMIELAKGLYPEIPNVDFEVCASVNLNDVEKYDWITSFCCLHWVRNPEKAMFAYHRALKTGGRILILAFPTEGANHDYLLETLAEPKWDAYRHLAASNSWRSSEQYQRIALEAGFKIELVHTE